MGPWHFTQFQISCPCTSVESDNQRSPPPWTVCHDNATSYVVRMRLCGTAIVSYFIVSLPPPLPPPPPHTHTHTHTHTVKRPMFWCHLNRQLLFNNFHHHGNTNHVTMATLTITCSCTVLSPSWHQLFKSPICHTNSISLNCGHQSCMHANAGCVIDVLAWKRPRSIHMHRGLGFLSLLGSTSLCFGIICMRVQLPTSFQEIPGIMSPCWPFRLQEAMKEIETVYKLLQLVTKKAPSFQREWL